MPFKNPKNRSATPVWHVLNLRHLYAASFVVIFAKCFPCETATSFSNSDGIRLPSGPAYVPDPYGDAPWGSSNENTFGSTYPNGTNTIP